MTGHIFSTSLLWTIFLLLRESHISIVTRATHATGFADTIRESHLQVRAGRGYGQLSPEQLVLSDLVAGGAEHEVEGDPGDPVAHRPLGRRPLAGGGGDGHVPAAGRGE